MIKVGLGLQKFDTLAWLPYDDIESWWCSMVLTTVGRHKGLASLLTLVSWELWNERNAGIFKNKSTMPNIVLKKIKIEARWRVLAGAKKGFYFPGRLVLFACL
jgi:hypothetical protein